MIYPNKYLMERDKLALNQANEVMHCGRVEFLTIDQIRMKDLNQSTWLVIDEADVLLYDKPE